MLFGHQNDAHQTQPDAAADQNTQDFVGPQDQDVQTVPPQDAGTQDVAAPQDPSAGVNPLAVDPATGASLPAVSNDFTAPTDAPAPADTEPVSVLDQPSTPSFGEAPSPESADAPAPAEAPVEDASAVASSGSPFSAAPAPVLDSTQEAQEAASIASELDTPGEEDQSTASTPEDASPGLLQGPVDDTTDQQADPQPAFDASAPASDDSTPVDNRAPAPAPTQDNSHLLELKQQAIAQLSPLINHLDQSSEEKFRTTMMLLQSTDNPALLHDAYTAAQSITDDGARAQALLDVVNEINYFTQQQSGN